MAEGLAASDARALRVQRAVSRALSPLWIPVFVSLMALAFRWRIEGAGELLSAIDLPEQWYLVLTPPVEVPTGMVFAAPELTRDTEPLKMADFSPQQQDRFKNDLEAVVTARFPEVANSLQWLRQHGKARMTGSGSCVFAEYDSRAEAQRILDRLPAPMTGFVAKGLTHHPLRAQ